MDDEGQRSSSRKRKRSPGAWKQNKRRKLRNQGEPYVSARSKSIPGKVRGSGCPDGGKCEFKCSENLTEEHREHLFKEFWKLGNFDEQNMYVAGCVTVRPVKRRYTTHGGESRRMFSRVYEFTVPLSADNEDSPLKVRVCKRTFVETLAISASRVDRLLGNKVRNPVRLSDQRGRQKNARKVSEERLHFVREHIKSFLAEESHYSRTENPAAQYLSGDLTLAHMYRLYVQKCTEEEKLPVKESFYRNVFMTEFNLRFKKPRSDTCKTCEELKVKIAATDDETEENNLKRDLELHHRKAEAARKAMDADSQVASVEEDSMCLCFACNRHSTHPSSQLGKPSISDSLTPTTLQSSTMSRWKQQCLFGTSLKAREEQTRLPVACWSILKQFRDQLSASFYGLMDVVARTRTTSFSYYGCISFNRTDSFLLSTSFQKLVTPTCRVIGALDTSNKRRGRQTTFIRLMNGWNSFRRADQRSDFKSSD